MMTSSEREPILKISKNKLELVKTLKLKAPYFLTKVCEQMERSFSIRVKDTSIDWLEELYHSHRTEQGILHYSMPKIMNAPLTEELFNTYFDKWIENK